MSRQEGENYHSVVDNLSNLPIDDDLYCFQAGINDYWTCGVLGTYEPNKFDGPLDTSTVCGAIETIFRHMRSINKPVVFIISHKIQQTADHKNAVGNTFKDYRDAMIDLCEKYGVSYYDAFCDSGLDGANNEHNKLYLTGNSNGEPDGTHPNEEGYEKFYVPQLIEIFEEVLK